MIVIAHYISSGIVIASAWWNRLFVRDCLSRVHCTKRKGRFLLHIRNQTFTLVVSFFFFLSTLIDWTQFLNMAASLGLTWLPWWWRPSWSAPQICVLTCVWARELPPPIWRRCSTPQDKCGRARKTEVKITVLVNLSVLGLGSNVLVMKIFTWKSEPV